MALVAKLLDVEQQLSRVTGVVQLHVKLTAASVAENGGLVETSPEVFALMQNVERAQEKLQMATGELLALIKLSLQTGSANGESDETNSNTEEFEMDEEHQVKVEEILATSQCNTSSVTQEIQFDSYSGDVEQLADVVQVKNELQEVGDDAPSSAFTLYVVGANEMVIASTMQDVGKNAKKMISDVNDAAIQAWSEVVDTYALGAIRELLERFRYGNFDNEVTASFVGATELAVSLITSRRVQLQKRKWLMRFDKGLFSILDAAKGTQLEQALLPVEKSHFDLMFFCSSTALDDMLSDVALVDRQDEIDAKELFPPFKVLIRKFVFDCEDYMLRNDTVGDSPRTEAQWAQFGDIGSALAKWLHITWTANVPFMKLDMNTIWEKLLEFDLQFDGRIPSTLLETLSRIVSNGFRKTTNENSSAVLPGGACSSSYIDAGGRVEPPECSIPITTTPARSTRLSKKRKRSPSSDCGRAEGEVVANLNPDTSMAYALTKSNDFILERKTSNTNEMERGDGVSVRESTEDMETSMNTDPLQVYLLAAKEAKQAFESMMQEPSESAASPTTDAVVVEKWGQVVRRNFTRASKLVISLLGSEKMNEEVAATFAEATVLAVSLITTATNGSFRRRWVLSAITLLENIHTAAEKSQFARALLPVSQSRDALLRYCDGHFPDLLEDTFTYVLKIEDTESEEIALSRLQRIIGVVASKFTRDCMYCVMRHRVGDLQPWSEDQWQKFTLAGCFLFDWTVLFMKASAQQPLWLGETLNTLKTIDQHLPGRLPRSLLWYSTSFTGVASMKEFSAGMNNSSTSLVKIGVEGDVYQISASDTGATRSDPETAIDVPKPRTSKIKRVKQSEDIVRMSPDTTVQIISFLDTATHLSQRFEAGEEIESFSKEAAEIQKLCIEAAQANKLFAKVAPLRDIDDDTAHKFVKATTILTELLCRCPSDCVGYARLKFFLKQYAHIRMLAAKHFAQLAASLASDYGKLQEYWQNHYADPFRAMRNHVESTERDIANLEPKRLEYPMRQLMCQFRDVCEVSLYEIRRDDTSSDRAQQFQAGFMEIGLLLSDWIQRLLEAGVRLQVPKLPKFLTKLIEVEAKSSGSIPASLIENVKHLQVAQNLSPLSKIQNR